MSETLSSGLTLTIPLRGEVNWETVVRTAFSAISAHDHTGSGNGLQIATAAIATDAVTDAKILLRNAQFLRGRNAANSADINILGLDVSNNLEIRSTTAKDIEMLPAGTIRWLFKSNGNFEPDADNNTNIGVDTKQAANVYTVNLNLGQADVRQSDGVKVIEIGNANTVPTTNPTDGGVLYATAGSLRWRGSSGTVTTIAAA